MTKIILFLCTGNYYRSRFSEIIFNHLALKARLDWKADSAALALELGADNQGTISQHTVEQLSLRGIHAIDRTRMPRKAMTQDFEKASRIIALREAEHRPYIQKRFNAFKERVEYWDILDIGDLHAGIGCQQMEQEVKRLIAQLSTQDSALVPTL